jgi:hypothetical protein
MSDYFDRVEQGMREAVRRGAHEPWYVRLRPRLSRPVVVAVACLVVTGSALAASGVLQTGTPVSPEVAPLATVDDGAPIPSSVRLLALRVSDPDGGPPWGLRTIKTTRGLECVQVGRIVDGRIGVLGSDGAFHDDGRFHPLSIDYLDAGSSNCATEDANGNAFLNEEAFGVPVDGLISGEREVSGGCYQPRPSTRQCPPGDRRNIYYGLLGPDATSITYLAADGKEHRMATVGPDGAYLVVLPHIAGRCLRGSAGCSDLHSPSVISRDSSGETGGPTLNAFGVVRAVNYRGRSSCHLPDGAEVEASERTDETAFRARLRERYPMVYRKLHDAEQRQTGAHLSPHERSELESLQQRRTAHSPESPCPAVGYVPLAPARHITRAQVASAVSAHVEAARHYCEPVGGGDAVGCDTRPRPGYRRIDMRYGPPQQLLIVEFTARVAVTNYDSHFEINTTDPVNRAKTRCPVSGGGGTFGPTDTNLRAGQRVRHAEFFNPECPGRSRITVGLVTVNGPSGATPVPGLPGQSAEIPVGHTSIMLP